LPTRSKKDECPNHVIYIFVNAKWQPCLFTVSRGRKA
jgi:hypothetical protein